MHRSSPSWRGGRLVLERPPARRAADDEAAIYVLAARTGGLKGALSVHSWIVLKRPGARLRALRQGRLGHRRSAATAMRPTGAGIPTRPVSSHAVHGEEAEQLLPAVRRARSRDYPYAQPRRLPDLARTELQQLRRPRSATRCPDFGGRLPPNAVGRDYAPAWRCRLSPDGRDPHATLGRLAGFSLGARQRPGVPFRRAGCGSRSASSEVRAYGPALGSVCPASSAEP